MNNFIFLLFVLGACAISMQDEKGKWRFDVCKCLSSKPKVCTPGAIEMKDCKNCTCSADATEWTCTGNPCPTCYRDDYYFVFNSGNAEHICKFCTCNSEGTGYDCNPSSCSDKTCTPGESSMHNFGQCYNCTCTADGFAYMCKSISCAEIKPTNRPKPNI